MQNKTYSWTVIGGGCAGVTAIAKLLDENISAKDILWIDKDFIGGDISKKWYEVPGNTKVDSLNKSFDAFESTGYQNAKSKLKFLDPEEVCSLGYLAEALKEVTKNLLNSGINTLQESVISVGNASDVTSIKTASQTIKTQKLILATGAEQRDNKSDNALSLDIALCPTKLENIDLSNKKIGVVGSSHSAILVMKNLVDKNVSNIVNFYRSFTKYAIPYNGKIIYDNTGLKGIAAAWAKENLENNPIINRIQTNSANYQSEINDCDIVIYAMGFEPRNIPINDITNYKHNPHHGIIAPNIYGLGIAYPETVTDEFGNIEQNVGLFKFVKFINKVFPIWKI